MFGIILLESVCDFFFLRNSIWFHLLGFLIGLSLSLGFEFKKRQHTRQKLSLLLAAWSVFAIFLGVKSTYDRIYPEKITALGAYGYGYLSELVHEEKDATRWYQKAAEKGSVGAQANLSYRYHIGQGVQKDQTKAFYWAHQAARKDMSWAQARLGYYYISGIGTPKDMAEAYYWYLRALQNPTNESLRSDIVKGIAYLCIRLSNTEMAQIRKRVAGERKQ